MPNQPHHGAPAPAASFRLVCLTIIALAAIAGCGSGTPEGQGGESGAAAAAGLQQILERGELVVLTRNGPTTLYEGREDMRGPEHDMAAAFAESLGVEVRFEQRDGVGEVLDALATGEGDIAAAAITSTPARRERFTFGPAYQTVQHQVICRRGGPEPDRINDLAEKDLLVMAGTSYAEHLESLREWDEGLDFRTSDDLDTAAILQKVFDGEVDCTVADSNVVAIYRRYLPELSVRFDIGSDNELAWALPPGADALASRVEDWFEAYEASGELDRVLEYYYGFVDTFDYVDVARFRRAVQERLPKYRKLFERAGDEYGVPWDLLAAQSYQESRWKANARSPTGVRGLMMLTLSTAKSLGVSDRLDPAQSVDGGARYLVKLKDRLAEDITEPDRTWIALAAYNVGMAHMHDAQILARRLERDPHLWADLKEVLPLLAQKRYYRELKHGYARGGEPVAYVQRIRDFQDRLQGTLTAASSDQ